MTGTKGPYRWAWFLCTVVLLAAVFGGFWLLYGAYATGIAVGLSSFWWLLMLGVSFPLSATKGS